MNPTKTLTAGLLIAALGAGCSSSTDYSRTQKGAAAGAATGAVIGGVIGHQSGETTAGAAIGAAAGGLAGAAIGRNQDRERRTDTDRQVYAVQSPPPTPTSQPYETVPPRPSADAVWVAGYYEYTGTGDQYRWVSGRWETPPPGYRTWAPPTWQRSGDGWVYTRGHWQ